MTTFLLALGMAMFLIAAMSIGVIFGRKPISGSCGGLNTGGSCEICGSNADKCEEGGPDEGGTDKDLAYDASSRS